MCVLSNVCVCVCVCVRSDGVCVLSNVCACVCVCVLVCVCVWSLSHLANGSGMRWFLSNPIVKYANCPSHLHI